MYDDDGASYPSPSVGPAWDALKQAAGRALGVPLGKLEDLGHDGGARAYARGTSADGTRTMILLDASSTSPRLMSRFWHVAAVLIRAGVKVPSALARVPELQLDVMTDLGRDTLSARHQRAAVGRDMIRDVTSALVTLGNVQSPAITETYNAAGEMRDFWEIFVPAARLQGWEPPRLLESALAAIWARTLDLSPPGLVHCDFHGRNVVIDDNDRVGVVDFQDACYGPIALDWAAIVYDHNRRPTRGAIARWELDAVTVLRDQMPAALIVRWLRWAGLFWHLRLVGACTRLLQTHDSTQFRDELRSVSQWLVALSALPGLSTYRRTAESVAHGALLVASEA
jgi:aminoglycoside/choline kinase family phosphotransferase